MRFEENLTLRGHQEGDEKSGGGFRIIDNLDDVGLLYTTFYISLDVFNGNLVIMSD